MAPAKLSSKNIGEVFFVCLLAQVFKHTVSLAA